jgi:DNA (cytosine-5)-methyltransferase 1
MTAYYNEIDHNAAVWLRELIKKGLIADGIVDERSIADVRGKDLKGFTQCHFFSGIGIWSHSLRQSGFPDDRPVWTGSCPCQPFSSAGKGKGFEDKRHLWPEFYRLIKECRPDLIFGEQVAGKAGEAWLDLVSADLESQDYAFGAAITAACGFGSPHQRKRLYWVASSTFGLADADLASSPRQREHGREAKAEEGLRGRSADSGESGDLGDPNSDGCDQGRQCISSSRGDGSSRDGKPDGLADACSEGLEERVGDGGIQREEVEPSQGEALVGSSSSLDEGLCGPVNGFWRDADWLGCKDGKWRPVEPGIKPLVDGSASSVGSSGDLSLQNIKDTPEGKVMRLKGYGNAIVAPQAQAFIESYLEVEDD